jgi:VanZ family protein
MLHGSFASSWLPLWSQLLFMLANATTDIPFVEKRVLRWMLFFYCLFILYGSFIPFRFSDDPAFVRAQWMRFFTAPFAHGVRRFSILDVVSNVLLFVPFGFLWIGAEIGRRPFGRLVKTVLAVGLMGFLFGLGIEAGQTFSPGRTASILDALSNGFGSALGGAAGYLFLRGLSGGFGKTLREIIRQRPSLILLGLLMVVPLAGAYYPFQITLDVSTVWDNLKHTQWLPFFGGFHRFWMDLVVEKMLVFAAIGYLILHNLRDAGLSHAKGITWGLCVAFAFCVEGGKLLFVGRVPNAENFILSSTGALLGILVLPSLAEADICRRYPIQILMTLVLALAAYSELSPFDWIKSIDDLPARLSKIEWLPFGAYYGADPQSALFDLGKKLFIIGPLGFLIAARAQQNKSRRQRSVAALVGLLTGTVLETSQLLLRSRTPSVTDVLLFGLATWAGAVIFERFSMLRRS